MRIVCYACSGDLGARERIGRRDCCERCGVELHSCRQCRFYDPLVYNACAEPQAERVLEKERANFCDYFAPAEAPAAGGTSRGRPAGSRPAAADDPGAAANPGAADDPGAAANPAAAGHQGAAGNPAAPRDARAELERLFRRR